MENNYAFAIDTSMNDEYIVVNDNPEYSVRPSSAFQDIRNGTARKNLKATTINKPISITDESIGRRKGSLMQELKTKLPKEDEYKNIKFRV